MGMDTITATKDLSSFDDEKQQPLLRLLQLVSPCLPVGAYAYSQGLEWVVHAGWVKDAENLERWLAGIMQGSLRYVDIPVMKHLYQACKNNDKVMLRHWNAVLLSYRETSELRKEEIDKGHAMARLLSELQISATLVEADVKEPMAFLTGYCRAAVSWGIECRDAAQGYLWSWLENQVVVAMKLIRLGQIDSQKILGRMMGLIPEVVDHGLDLADDEIGALLPAQSIACAQHEMQYTRLFRS